MSRLQNGQCYNANQNMYKQCNNLNGRIIPSCSNVYGIDGWPASTPNQSNVPYTNGISGVKPPNGFKQYIQPMYLYDGNLYKPHTRFIYTTQKLKSNKSFFYDMSSTAINNTTKYVFVEDLKVSKLRLFNVLGSYLNPIAYS